MDEGRRREFTETFILDLSLTRDLLTITVN
jgi:hypothetical protein